MFIYSNLAISLDGKIATAERQHHPVLGSITDRKNMMALRKGADAILMGASSLRAYKKPLLTPDKIVTNVILSRNLKGINSSFSFFKSDQTKRIIFLTGKITKKREKEFSKSSTIIHLKSDDHIREMVKYLRQRKIKSLLIEGGSEIMWEFVSRNLIREYNITLTPYIIGGTEAPSLVGGKGFPSSKIKKLHLVSSRKIRDEVFLVYRR